MEWIKRIFVGSIEVGDKVGYSDKALDSIGGNRDFYSKHVFEVFRKDDIMHQGVRLYVGKYQECSYLEPSQAKKLPIETPVWG